MSQKVYVHIGLPKTATTSLQLDFFPRVDNSRYQYLGVLQLREKRIQDPLFEKIVSATRSGENLHEVNIAIQKRLIKEQRSLIISEEMFTVGNTSITWQEQLANLCKILSGIECKLLVTVREPVSAMFSFYVELYQRFENSGLTFAELALNHNDFAIYHYDSLLAVLLKCFDSQQIQIQRFEDIVLGDYTDTLRFLDSPLMEDSFRSVENHNQKVRAKGAVLVSKKVKLLWVSNLYRLLGGDESKFMAGLKRLSMPALKILRNFTYKKIPVPTLPDSERRLLKSQISGTMIELAERFSVKY